MPVPQDDFSPECRLAGWLNSDTPSVHHLECRTCNCGCRCHATLRQKVSHMTPFSPRVQSRLWNWKFTHALEYLREDDVTRYPCTEDQAATIEALASTFGNCGHLYGSLGDVIRAAVCWLLNVPADAPEDWLPDGIRKEYEAERRSRGIHPATGRYAAEPRNQTLERRDTRPWGDEA